MGRFGYSIFCDDIRNEPGEKLSFVGCYNGVIFVPPTFPLVLPRFCIHIHIVSPATEPYESIAVRCYAPCEDAPIVEEPVEPPPREEQVALLAKLGTNPDAPLYIVAGTSLILMPLQLNGPGLIRVRAVVDGAAEELRLGSLRVEARH
jgi:hypothetical protein